MQWTRDDDKLFETALLQFSEDSPNRWENLAEFLQKPVAEVIKYYDALVHDVALIESGGAVVPNYVDHLSPTEASQISSQSKNRENDRKRGIPWTHEEHGLFIEGLNKYGRGDWKSISRDFVQTRTPTQVASHAQKYYLRQVPGSKARKRSSIHDTTWVDADNVTVQGSDLDSRGQPHFGDQMPQNYSHNYFRG